MEDTSLQTGSPVLRIAAVMAAAVLGVVVVGYGVHEHHAAVKAAAQSTQTDAELVAARNQLNDLTAKVSALTAPKPVEAAPEPATVPAAPVVHRVAKPHAGHAVQDRRFAKLQAELDAQGREIEQTRGDLQTSTTQLTGSIARTHDELVVLEKRGQRSYYEFDLAKDKQFKREGPVGVSLRKANVKHQYADLQLMVDDRSLTQKHVNLDQPVMFYEADTEQPIQIVINDITKDHIHGYVSTPMYRKSELEAMATANTNPDQASPDAQAAPRKKLTVGQQDGTQQDGPQD
jgi:hypothetical protein